MKFDAYEFIAVIIPGALPTLAVSLLIPEVAAVLKSDGVGLGSFGIFLIVSYVIGHAVQVVGNGIEKVETIIGFGMIDMAVKAHRRPVDNEQWIRFTQRLNDQDLCPPSGPNEHTWPGIRREVYAYLKGKQKTDRIDIFNRVYGLCRGMVAGTLVTGGLVFLLSDPTQWNYVLITLALSLLLYIRMRRFSAHYFKEIVAQFCSVETP